MAHHKSQHFVAATYLKAWCDPRGNEPSPFLWVFPAEGGEPRRKAPRKICKENDLYTIVQNGRRDLQIETMLGRLETFIPQIREHLVAQAPLSVAQYKLLLFFAAAQAWRTPTAREQIRSMYTPVLKAGEQLERSIRRMTPDERRKLPKGMSSGGPSMSMDDVRRAVEQPLQTSMWGATKTTYKAFQAMRPTFIVAPGPERFITSDHPCVFFDPEQHLRPFPHNGLGLGFRSVEVTLPLTPDVLLLLSYSGEPAYVAAPPWLVTEMNRRTRAFADSVFIGSSREAKMEWYLRGSPPTGTERGPSVIPEAGL